MKLLYNKSYPLLDNLAAFTESVKSGVPVAVDENAHCYIPGAIAKLLDGCPFLAARRKGKIIDQLIGILKASEKSHLNASAQLDYNSLIRAAEAVIGRFGDVECLERPLLNLRRYVVALKYRVGAQSGGVGIADVDECLMHDLTERAHIWKLAHHILDEKVLNKKDIERLTIACSYREFVELLLEDDLLTDTFFLWTIRDRINPVPFIEFPEIQHKIVESCLNGRISRFGGNGIKVMQKGVDAGYAPKVVTLLMEGRDVDIMDENSVVTFRGNYKVTVGQIFDIFKNKEADIGNFEYLQEGIVNWNMFKWAWWNAEEKRYISPDFTKSGWWKDLPVFEIISKKETRKRYGKQIDGIAWNLAAVSTRGTLTMDFEDSHAFTEVAVPVGNGMYRIYPFGKYGIIHAVTLMEKLAVVGKTVPATISYPDENVYFTFRQHTRTSFKITAKQGMAFMENVLKDLIKGFEKNFVYQIETENCARWAQNQIERIVGENNVPNLFITPLLNAEPQGPVQYIFGLIKKFPKSWHVKMLMLVHIPLGALCGQWIEENGVKVWKAITHHEFWETGVVYLPAYLHHQKDNGRLGHVVMGLHDILASLRSCFEFEGGSAIPTLKRFTKDFLVQVLYQPYQKNIDRLSLSQNSLFI